MNKTTQLREKYTVGTTVQVPGVEGDYTISEKVFAIVFESEYEVYDLPYNIETTLSFLDTLATDSMWALVLNTEATGAKNNDDELNRLQAQVNHKAHLINDCYDLQYPIVAIR